MGLEEKLQALADGSSWSRLIARKLGRRRILRPIKRVSIRYPIARRLNWLAGILGASTYLEIGVHAGLTFERVSIARKWGVDPSPRFDSTRLPAAWTVCECTSDEFFQIPEVGNFDLVFIDGWHECDQVLKDLRNSLKHLSSGGMIVIDDVYPGSTQAAERYSSFASQSDAVPPGWTGDVFKVVYLLSLLDPDGTTYCTLIDKGPAQTVVLKTAISLSMDQVPADWRSLRWERQWNGEIPMWMHPLREPDFRTWLARYGKG